MQTSQTLNPWLNNFSYIKIIKTKEKKERKKEERKRRKKEKNTSMHSRNNTAAYFYETISYIFPKNFMSLFNVFLMSVLH